MARSGLRGNWELVDNAELGTHDDALRYLGTQHGVPIHVATGYLGLDGLHTLAEVGQESGVPVRLMLGALPSSSNLVPESQSVVQDEFERSVEVLKGARNFGAFPEARRRQLERIYEFVERDTTDVRRYVERFLHGKAYIFSEGGDGGYMRAALVTSANLTGAGLNTNLELGMVHYQPNVVRMTLDWYDRLWEESEDYKDALLDLLLPDLPMVDPRTVYLRAVYELYGDEDEVPLDGELGLSGFQLDGYLRAKRIMERHGGVLYADGVGMGKTEIGVEFIRDYMRNQGQQVLVVTPAQLRDGLWNDRLAVENLRTEVISFNQLASDEQLSLNATERRRHLRVDKDAYRLIVVDEAHALRNADSSWWLALDRLMSGTMKKLLLLTATPVNNTLWDLHNLFLLFARHDAAFADEPLRIRSLRKYFDAAGATDPELLSAAKLFKLLDALVVRRHREFVMKHYPDQILGQGVRVKFPKPKLIECRYKIDEAVPEAVQHIVDGIGELAMALYTPSAYRIDADPDERELYNAGFLQSMLLKRLESSWYAALKTVERIIGRAERYIEYIEANNSVPPRKLLDELLEFTLDVEGISTKFREAAAGLGSQSIPLASMREEFLPHLKQDLCRFRHIRDLLQQIGGHDDAKLFALRQIMHNTGSDKAVIFTQFKETAEYLRSQFERDADLLDGRKFVAIIGSESSALERAVAVERFGPGADTESSVAKSGNDEVNVLLSTDVLAEGQNLQMSQAVVSYDMPWNPQRVVQRNGRVIRLKSPHDKVYLYTLLTEQGDLTRLLKLEARLQAKIEAANASIGMENPVLASVHQEQRNFTHLEGFTDRLASGDASLLDESQSGINAEFSGEYFRQDLKRAKEEGELDYIRNLPWGIGAKFTQDRFHDLLPAVFFACRTRHGQRYWRMVSKSGAVAKGMDDLEMLQLIEPGDASGEELNGDWDLNRAFEFAAADIVEEHNALSDPAAVESTVPASQRWATNILRSQAAASSTTEYERPDQALSVGRNLRVVRALSSLRSEYADGAGMSLAECADRIVAITREFGLSPVEAPKPTVPITAEDIGVVCYQVVHSQGHTG